MVKVIGNKKPDVYCKQRVTLYKSKQINQLSTTFVVKCHQFIFAVCIFICDAKIKQKLIGPTLRVYF